MSRLWPERLLVVLAPHRVELSRRARLGRTQREHDSEACAESREGEAWRPAVDALARLLARTPRPGAAMDVVLSSHFVRFQVVPWQAELSDAQEQQAYARHLFREVYGSLADAWEVRLSEEPPGAPAVACAIDGALLEALRNTASDARLRLRSVQPCYAAVFNRRRGALRGDSVVFAMAEPGRVCLGLLRDERWLALRNQGSGEDVGQALASMLDQAALAVEPPLAGATIYLGQVDGAPLPQSLGPRWPLQRLTVAVAEPRAGWLAWCA